LAALAAVLAVACTRPADPPVDVPDEPELPPAPIVVYASYADANYLPSLFAEFTAETGRRVTVRNGPTTMQVDRVIDGLGSPPADLLISPDVQGIWRAANEGALRPYQSDAVDAAVPAAYRDPDGEWTAIAQHSARVVYRREHAGDALVDWDSLADASNKGRLCLSSSSLPLNRAIIANLVRERGARDAEILVRGWIRNLALPPFPSEAALIHAVQDGTCAIALVSSTAQLPGADETGQRPLESVRPEPVYANVEAAGIARHAHEPDAARELLEWLLSDAVQAKHAAATRSDRVTQAAEEGQRDVGIAGWNDSDAVLLAERAAYR
jgi:iron(III) transport system substrate-binding protein